MEWCDPGYGAVTIILVGLFGMYYVATESESEK